MVNQSGEEIKAARDRVRQSLDELFLIISPLSIPPEPKKLRETDIDWNAVAAELRICANEMQSAQLQTSDTFVAATAALGATALVLASLARSLERGLQ